MFRQRVVVLAARKVVLITEDIEPLAAALHPRRQRLVLERLLEPDGERLVDPRVTDEGVVRMRAGRFWLDHVVKGTRSNATPAITSGLTENMTDAVNESPRTERT